jgi:hypothetical protein
LMRGFSTTRRGDHGSEGHHGLGDHH